LSGCTACGGKPFHTRRYSGEVLCRDCFRKSIVEKTRRTIAKYSMVKRGERVGVAVSGGKDSLSLLHVLNELRGRNAWELVVLSVDEGVRGYREEALAHAKEAADRFGLEQVVLSYQGLYGFSLDEALGWEGRDISSCSFCGVFRRRAIDEAAARTGVDVVATAHNLDDYVQTFLMNLMHGDAGRIGWLDPSYSDGSFPIRRVKPFMEVYEEEIALFAYESGIPFQSVSCPYMHEGLRSEVRDYLNQMETKHPGIKNVLLRSGLEIISHFTPSDTRRSVPCSNCGRPSSSGLCNVCRLEATINHHVNLSD
jgi:uncharacterized protein (TIGR00269 family)